MAKKKNLEVKITKRLEGMRVERKKKNKKRGKLEVKKKTVPAIKPRLKPSENMKKKWISGGFKRVTKALNLNGSVGRKFPTPNYLRRLCICQIFSKHGAGKFQLVPTFSDGCNCVNIFQLVVSVAKTLL